MTNTESQNKNILIYLQSGGRITPLRAFDLFKCFRLAARIFDIKGQGYDIKKDMVGTGNTKYAEYYL